MFFRRKADAIQMEHSGSYKDRDSGKGFRIEHWQIIAAVLMLFDILAVNLSYFTALWIRFDCKYSQIP